jgi:spermidine synthase
MVGESRNRLLSPAELADGLTGTFQGTTFLDVESENRVVVNRVDRILASEESPFQRIDIFRTPHFGLILALDGITQAAELDEHFYHELLIHPACLTIPRRGSALIMGGGDGCAARELLKYSEFATLEMVEIDQAVIELCRTHFKEINRGALEDPRLEIIVGDGETYLRDHPDKRYDLIVADLTEPYDLADIAGELSRHIFSRDFYDMLKGHMNPGAILVIQTGAVTHIPDVDRYHREIIEGLKAEFHTIRTAYKYIHSFDAIWSITLASDRAFDIHDIQPDALLADLGVSDLRWYDGISHKAAFQPTPEVRDLFRDR